jgi:hypothetical protein
MAKHIPPGSAAQKLARAASKQNRWSNTTTALTPGYEHRSIFVAKDYDVAGGIRSGALGSPVRCVPHFACCDNHDPRQFDEEAKNGIADPGKESSLTDQDKIQ